MALQSLRIQLPQKVSTNQFYRLHYFKRQALQQQYYLAIKQAVRRSKCPPVAKYPVGVRYIFGVPGRPLDLANLTSAAKQCEDGLRHAGILKDDSPKYVSEVVLREVPAKQFEVLIEFFTPSTDAYNKTQ